MTSLSQDLTSDQEKLSRNRKNLFTGKKGKMAQSMNVNVSGSLKTRKHFQDYYLFGMMQLQV